MNQYSVTGTFHGSLVYADSEGEARRIFHRYYNGESIIHLKHLQGHAYNQALTDIKNKLQ